jgi:hypothetical protein
MLECLECTETRTPAVRVLTLREQGQTNGGVEFPVCARHDFAVRSGWYSHAHGRVHTRVLATGEMFEGRWVSSEELAQLRATTGLMVGGGSVDGGAVLPVRTASPVHSHRVVPTHPVRARRGHRA